MSFQMPPRPKFTTEDSVKIVERWCELKDIHKVRWRYTKEKGIEKFPRKLPTRKNFKCVIDRFKKTGSVKMERPKKIDGKHVTENEENIEKVRQLITRNAGMSLNQISIETNLPKTSVWRILRMSLNFYPYRISLTTKLTDAHKRARMEYNRWLLQQPECFPEFVNWSDEKLFLLHTCPKRQNECYWHPKGDDPHIEEACHVDICPGRPQSDVLGHDG